MNETIDLIKSHKSIRKYLDKPVEDNIVREIITSAQAASTSSFMQAYTIINVTDIEKKKTIRTLSGDQAYIEECPLFIIFCADLHKFEIACDLNSEQMQNGYTEAFIIATVDAALAAQNAMIAAESLGLGGVYIGGIRNNPKEVSNLLELPDNVYAVFGMCLGYPAENPEIKLRLPFDAVCCNNKYDLDSKIGLLKQYDEKIRDYYIERTNGVRCDTWTNQMSKHVSKPLRPHMKAFLNSKGFLNK
ncbi:putative oxygen-insensitive NADPH nitroreductase [Clostridiales bacterium oral taxon 876 str. F0540]|nr:putative oxygen-insensitive NADPH nitroreductase [Clostridiales bacterium oral taxon 876 str. F0540]